MRNLRLSSRCSFSYFLQRILLSWILSSLEFTALPSLANGNESDLLALLDFKNRVTQGPFKILDSWNDSNVFCNWIGVACSPSSGRVVVLNLESQKLVGSIPPSIGNLTFLTGIKLGDNGFHGEVPQEIGRLLRLQDLNLTRNSFRGKIPTNLTHCTELRVLDSSYNEFIGQIPDQLSSLSKFEGSIPPSLGNCQKLLALKLSSNNLSGTIPKQIWSLSSLTKCLSLSQNFLTGSLPAEVGQLDKLEKLDLSNNKLSGEIPNSIGSCTSLESLHLEGNAFGGTIPLSLTSLRGIEEIDLSYINLTGKIPDFLSKILSLRNLNLSYNHFDGEVSQEGIFANASAISIIGNNKLCGGVSELYFLPCSSTSSRKNLTLIIVSVVTGIVALIILPLCSFATHSLVRNARSHFSPSSSKDWRSGVSYSDIVKSTNGFSEENLIGSGSFGSVYKGIIANDGTVVAMKVLKLQQQGVSKSFIDECNALRSVRHRKS